MLEVDPNNSPSAALRRMMILLLAAVVVALGIVARADSVHLYDHVGVQGPRVTLGQVADLQGPAAKAHSGVVLMTLKDSREGYTITLDRVEQALDKAGVNWGLVSLRGFNQCEITRLIEPVALAPEPGQAVAANIETPIDLHTTLTLQVMVEQLLADRAGVSVEDIMISLSERDAKKLDVPILGRSVEIEPTSLNPLGRVPIVVRLYESRRVAETIHINVKVARKMLAVVTTVPITRGEVFSRSKLRVRECVIDDSNVTPITDPSIMMGQESTTSLRAGEIVSVRSVRPPLMVKRGDLVEVRCFIGGLIIRTVGLATENGSLDETILIKNETTKEVYRAVVTGRQEVIVSKRSNQRRNSSTVMANDRNQEMMP